jgi:predicted enzyme related to lactoylglutathione lyase
MSQPSTLHSLSWFEIPVRDLDRAEAFYGQVCDQPLLREQIGEASLAVFPKSADGIGGCLFASPHGPAPSTEGTLVYLNAAPSLDAALARVEKAGGRITLARTALPEGMGFFAHFVDCEGNRVGLHALA